MNNTFYDKDNIKKSALSYFGGNELAADVWINKYALKNNSGEYLELTPDDMHDRVAKEFARVENKFKNSLSQKEIYELLKDFKYIIPAGSPLYGIGNNYQISSLANCFVIGHKYDSYGNICKIDEEQVQLMKRRGGVGHDLSHLRPAGAPTTNSAGTSTGIVPFMRRYSNSTREVGQDGRRGALMLTLDINHPDIEAFISSKDDLSQITGANISVKITDEFMDAVKHDKPYMLRFPTDAKPKMKMDMQAGNQYAFDNSIQIKVMAKPLFDKIVHQAWKSGEPGILFFDKIIRESPADCYKNFQTVSVNPCAELSLSAYDSCRLLHINLYSYVENPFTNEAQFNWEKFKEHTKIAQRLSDDIIELEIEKINSIISKIRKDPEPDYIKKTELNLWTRILDTAVMGRRTGLGIVGLADMLAALNMRYSSEDANKFSLAVIKHLAIYSYISSIELAEERGPFPIWGEKHEKDNPFIQRIMNKIENISPSIIESYKRYGRRNIANLTIAPTGTISILAGISSGIEPVFNLSYKRRRKVDSSEKELFVDQNGDKWEEYNVLHPKFDYWFRHVYKGSESDITELMKTSPYYKAIANEINPIKKVEMQGAIQRYIDHSISVTHNVPEKITEEEVFNLYMKAYDVGCKGVTVYREGSRSGVLINKKKFKYYDAAKRPKELPCEIYRLQALGQKWMVLVGVLEDKPYEIFALKEPDATTFPKKYSAGKIVKVKKGVYNLVGINGIDGQTLEDISSFYENDDERASTRRYSLMLRHGINPKYVVETIDSEPGTIVSFNKAISRVLRDYTEKEVGQCTECGSNNVRYEGGCTVCDDCGYSKCG